NFPAAAGKAGRREVRLNSRAPSRSSSRLTAFETVALDSESSVEAAANDRNSTTFAKIARASKSGSFAIGRSPFAQNRKQLVSIVSISIPRREAYPSVIG